MTTDTTTTTWRIGQRVSIDTIPDRTLWGIHAGHGGITMEGIGKGYAEFRCQGCREVLWIAGRWTQRGQIVTYHR